MYITRLYIDIVMEEGGKFRKHGGGYPSQSRQLPHAHGGGWANILCDRTPIGGLSFLHVLFRALLSEKRVIWPARRKKKFVAFRTVSFIVFRCLIEF